MERDKLDRLYLYKQTRFQKETPDQKKIKSHATFDGLAEAGNQTWSWQSNVTLAIKRDPGNQTWSWQSNVKLAIHGSGPGFYVSSRQIKRLKIKREAGNQTWSWQSNLAIKRETGNQMNLNI